MARLGSYYKRNKKLEGNCSIEQLQYQVVGHVQYRGDFGIERSEEEPLKISVIAREFCNRLV